ncbi:hypothetical protein SAMN05444920_105302 [Nonomuraea solani]|uniref:Uncharacterized protein n=1 Tax=Nonomuraea solani TaxID=1144553 RepID=A0A1H6DHF6_9ACTN|nr:hypothetical protein [Nonomuraea solani]SEG84036.1 hypothetical protein SAMN05444920_105302 [Nonomuraea solani]
MSPHPGMPEPWEKHQVSPEAREQSKITAARRAIDIALQTRFLWISREKREAISACEDLELLQKWLIRILTVDTVDELFPEPG